MLCAALFTLVVALHFYVEWVGSFPGDTWALHQGWYPHSTGVSDYADFFAYLATPTTAVVFLVVGIVVLLARGLIFELGGFVVAYGVIPCNAILKLVFGPSPLWARFHPGSHNYPSGHVTFVTAVIGYLGLVSWRQGHRRPAALAALLVIGIGPARVATGVHLVSDVVAGYMIGACFLILGYIYSQPRTTGPGVDATTTP